MRYRSTRAVCGEPGGNSVIGFSDAVLTGLADDGGLLIPVAIPRVAESEVHRWKRMSYVELCFEVMRLYIDVEEVPSEVLRSIISDAYSSFRHEEIAPIRAVGDFYFLELFHGPTFAFKDLALQFLGVLFDYLLRSRQRNMLVLGATSGDTGSAAIGGLKDRERIDCVILYPKGATSRIQQLQMTTCTSPNINCVEISGTFDDCQNLVKQAFQSSLKADLHLGAVNSINWARILAQIVYYWYASFRVLEKEPEASSVDFVVPTGNFGNILAGYYAQQMGAPIGGLVIASNSNDVLVRCRNTGQYAVSGAVQKTVSPSMDIQVSSNFERFLFDAMGANGKKVREKFEQLSRCGGFTVGDAIRDRTAEVFGAYKANDGETMEAVKLVFDQHGWIMDPHTAVGFVCAKKYRDELANTKDNESSAGGSPTNPLVCVATAHFGKFVDTIEELVPKESIRPQMPIELLYLDELPQRSVELPAELSNLKKFLLNRFRPSYLSQTTSLLRGWINDNTILVASVGVAAIVLTAYCSVRMCRR
eukprot:GHVS01107969.1.p1 GENE.GHVS01107969.1~~GHVS01107969.1.p1  ORF type:complete len:533 (+),score=47.44 GHVS01107969.1:325-1923(+)